MKIQLTIGGETYHLKAEENSFTAVKLGTVESGLKKGEVKEEVIGYFSKVSAAVKKIVGSHLASLDEVITLKEYSERIEASYEALMKQVDL